ncbi:hypothetical protein JTE90_013267 [Oedothorax gibbosus]|uniref:RNA-directed DNA polymerase n=1 Tax=Oedothorax gibbosus TaxID=931172 RepID=A0AAV6VD04_9ARAC|nr:hypothetical protein JTE90_013267 [Oedothorax gibbosus]
MSFLGKGKKQDLLVVCEELGEKVDHLSKVPEIKKKQKKPHTRRREEQSGICLTDEMMTYCHERAASHLGIAKTKDALFKTFYWPNCYREVEAFVKSCDLCQRVGKPQDKKKAPLKLVPVITEIFSKINVDAVGPLPVTPSGNKYLITAVCMSSKYPDAIPVENLKSTSIIDALLQVFSRMGFPKELQTDQGTH